MEPSSSIKHRLADGHAVVITVTLSHISIIPLGRGKRDELRNDRQSVVDRMEIESLSATNFNFIWMKHATVESTMTEHVAKANIGAPALTEKQIRAIWNVITDSGYVVSLKRENWKQMIVFFDSDEDECSAGEELHSASLLCLTTELSH